MMKIQDKLGNFFYKMFLPISKGKGNPREVDLRCKKCGDQLAMAIYKVCITVFAYSIMKDSYFFPKLLGGSGSYS